MPNQNSDAPTMLRIDGAIATITLNRPEAYNAIDIETAVCLESLAATVEARDDVRVLVINAAGKAFCAGGDVKLFAEHIDNLGPPISALLNHLNGFLLTLRRMPQIVITSVQGAAAGAGFSLAFMGDLCIAADNARFRPAYAQIGVSPDAGGTVGVVQTVGPRVALQLFLGEPEISSERAERLGLVSKIVPAAELTEATVVYAQALAAISPVAAAMTKKLIWQSAENPLSDQLNAEQQAILGCMGTPEFKARVRSFGSR